MNTTARAILDAALNLPDADRADVAQELLNSLSPESERFLDDAWAAELERRWQEFQAAPETAISWSELVSPPYGRQVPSSR